MLKEAIKVLYLWNRFDFMCLKLLAGAIETRGKHSFQHVALKVQVEPQNNIQMNNSLLFESKWRMEFSVAYLF